MKIPSKILTIILVVISSAAICQKRDSTITKPDPQPKPDSLSCLCSEIAKTQGITTICFDFKTKMFLNQDDLKLQALKLGQLYRLVIFNINTNLYKISIGKRDTVINTALNVPTFSGFGISDLNTLVSGITTATNIVTHQPATVLDASTAAVKNQAYLLFDKGMKIDSGIKAMAHATRKTAPPNDDVVKLIQNAYGEKLKKSYTLLEGYKRQTDDLINLYNRYLIQAQLEYSDASNAQFFGINGSLNDVYTRLNALRQQINDLSDDVDAANNKYTNQIASYATVLKNNDDLKKADDLLKATYTSFATALGKAKDVVSVDNSNKFISSLTVVINNTKRQYLSFPLQFNKDQNILVLNVQPRKDDSGLEPYTTSFVFPIRRHDFWAVSTGVYGSSLYNETYSTLESIGTNSAGKPDTTYSLKSEKPKKMEFGLNVMVRYGWQIGADNKYNYWQVGAGPGVSIADKVRGRLLLGTGFAHGKNHKLIIDVGVITGYVDKISVLYTVNTPNDSPPTTPVISKLSFGFYGGIGYLFN